MGSNQSTCSKFGCFKSPLGYDVFVACHICNKTFCPEHAPFSSEGEEAICEKCQKQHSDLDLVQVTDDEWQFVVVDKTEQKMTIGMITVSDEVIDRISSVDALKQSREEIAKRTKPSYTEDHICECEGCGAYASFVKYCFTHSSNLMKKGKKEKGRVRWFDE